LSLKEYLNFKDVELNDEIFFEYIKFGGLPGIVNLEDETIKIEYLKGIYNTIFVKDLIEICLKKFDI